MFVGAFNKCRNTFVPLKKVSCISLSLELNFDRFTGTNYVFRRVHAQIVHTHTFTCEYARGEIVTTIAAHQQNTAVGRTKHEKSQQPHANRSVVGNIAAFFSFFEKNFEKGFHKSKSLLHFTA